MNGRKKVLRQEMEDIRKSINEKEIQRGTVFFGRGELL